MALLAACGGASAPPTCGEAVAALGNGRSDNRLVELCARWPEATRRCIATDARRDGIDRCLAVPPLPLALIAPSTATRQLVAANPQPLHAQAYVDPNDPHDAAALRYAKALMPVEVAAPEYGHKLRLVRGARWIEVPIDPTDKIAYLDREVATALAHLHDTRRAYYVTGHGEVPWPRTFTLRLALEAEHVTVAPVELTAAIPADAALVLWIGPTAPLAPREAEVLARYLTRGGKLVVAIDPPYDLGALAPILGVRLDPVLLRDHHHANTAWIDVHRSGAHPSTGKHGDAMLAERVGALSLAGMSTAKVTFTFATPISSWRDTNGNGALDPDEPPQAYPIAAASDGYAFRALVFGSASLWSDGLPIQGYLASTLAWLLGQDQEIEIADAAVPSATLVDAIAARKEADEARTLAAKLLIAR